MANKLTSEKALQILSEGRVHGNRLTRKQKKFFGAVAGGAAPEKAENGIEGTMGGLTNKGFNFNPAWGGAWREGGDLPKSQKGKNVCPPGFVNIEGKCYDRSSDEYKDLYREGIGYLDETGTLVSSRMELPEVVVKPESVLNFLDETIGPSSGGSARYAFDQLGKKYGFPEIKSQKEYKKNNPISLFSLPKARGHYWDNTIYADDVPTYLSELAHHTMFKDKGRVNQIRNWIGNDMIEYVTGNNPYKKEGTIEYEAHKIVEPKLREEYIKHKKKYFFDTYGLNENVGIGVYKNGGWLEKYAMGGSLPGSVGFTYARVAGAAPSEGPRAKKTMPSAQNGEKLSYSKWKKQYNLKETPDYNLKRAWELGYTPDKTGHLPTVDNQTGQFLKAKGHPTLQLELDWYNSPEAADFRSKNVIDSSGRFFKYVPRAQNGMEMKYYQEGLDFKPKTISKNGGWLDKFDDGGVVKDDMGYWNPENWGKVVEIDSPYITMKGVDQPLIGVSDTGDVQYMEPGNDYEFDGTSVREYPVAAQGVSVNKADEYPLEKLDNLLNFTNYNKPKAKNGWLEKYK